MEFAALTTTSHSPWLRPLFAQLAEAGLLQISPIHHRMKLDGGVKGEKPWLGERRNA